jgi:gamma-glutamyl-gamma-aminobutyrate hydrolase PuuD
VIGITSYAEEASWGHWTLPAALVPLSYVRSVEAAGGRPLLVPPSDDGVEETLAAVDGLIFSGGADLDPAGYGEESNGTIGAQADRDRTEIALLEGALARDVPVLAICRGMQLLNVARGGSLEQHLPDVVGHEGHRETRGAFSDHDVRLAQGSRAAAILGDGASIRSSHHQGPARIGSGLEPVGWADDGTIEALESPGQTFAVGVLWHPEEGEDKRLFEALVEAARAYRAAR